MKIPSAKGLENAPGANNCFLNVIVQCFLHLDPFKNLFCQQTVHSHADGACIFCALQAIFEQYLFTTKSQLPVSELRTALDQLYKNHAQFQIGEYADAAEAYVFTFLVNISQCN